MADKQRYKVITGLNYPPNGQRAGAGSVVDDLPATSIPWLVEQGHIEKTTEPLNRIVDVDLVAAPAEDAQAPTVEPPAPAVPAKKEG